DGYQQSLSPYGSWLTEPGYGQLWQPSVPVGWQPYADGHWVWTAFGWTWTSYEPWSWTFHYGRWGYLPPRGWVWFPGTVWGPAWVTWVTYSDYVGWAPLSPFGQPVLNNFVFVRSYDFCAPQLRTLVVGPVFLPAALRMHWQDHVVRSPERRFIEEVSRHPVRVLDDRPADTLAPWQRADRGSDPGPERPHRLGSAPAPGVGREERNRRRPVESRMQADDRPGHDRAERPWFRPPRGDRPSADAPAAVQPVPGFDGDRRLSPTPRMNRDPGRTGGPAEGGGGRPPLGRPAGRPIDRGNTGRTFNHGSAAPARGGAWTGAQPH